MFQKSLIWRLNRATSFAEYLMLLMTANTRVGTSSLSEGESVWFKMCIRSEFGGGTCHQANLTNHDSHATFAAQAKVAAEMHTSRLARQGSDAPMHPLLRTSGADQVLFELAWH